MKRLSLAPNGVFWTLNGEGTHAGEPQLFIRLAGCSVACPNCDTDYRVSRRVTPEELADEARTLVPAAFAWPWAWITGGEPTDQDTLPLVLALQAKGFRVALATSGVRPLSRELIAALNFLSVSPHAPLLGQQHGHEIKLVPGLGALTWDNLHQVNTGMFAFKYIQPLAGSAFELQKAIAFCLNVPGWQLSGQAHKKWGLP